MKILLLIFVLLFLFSCSEPEEKWMIQESWEIINEYVDTLEWSIGDSKEVRDLLNKNNDRLKNSLQITE